jgi:hypothetical protein
MKECRVNAPVNHIFFIFLILNIFCIFILFCIFCILYILNYMSTYFQHESMMDVMFTTGMLRTIAPDPVFLFGLTAGTNKHQHQIPNKYTILKYLPDKIARFLYEYHYSDYLSLDLPPLELDRSDTNVHGFLKPCQVDNLFKYVEYVQYTKYVEYVQYETLCIFCIFFYIMHIQNILHINYLLYRIGHCRTHRRPGLHILHILHIMI